MVFSNRERYVAIAVAVAVGIFLIDRYLLSPYLTRLEELGIKQQDAAVELEKQQKLKREQRDLKPVWNSMRTGGSLVTDRSQAEARLLEALQQWADESGVKVGTRKPDQPVPDGEFLRTGVQFSGSGSTAAVAKFLWRLETAPLPVRVSELTLRSRQPNTDELMVTLNVSTLSIVPSAENPEDPGGSGTGGAGRAAAPADALPVDAPPLARGGRS